MRGGVGAFLVRHAGKAQRSLTVPIVQKRSRQLQDVCPSEFGICTRGGGYSPVGGQSVQPVAWECGTARVSDAYPGPPAQARTRTGSAVPAIAVL